MKKLYFLFTLFITFLSFAQSTDLYFSMYAEGSSNNKFYEIYNGTGSSVDLGNYSVELYANGATTATNTLTFPASTMLASGDVYVVYNSSSNATIISAGDISSSTCNYNGDDALALLKLGSVIDVIGQIGSDPGTAWNVGSTTGATVNHTLVRKNSVCSPNPVALSSFGTDDTTSEWIVYAIDAEWGQIGSHSGCSTLPSLAISSPSNATLFNPLTTSVNVSFSVANFTVANGTGDGYIKYSVNGGSAVDQFDTSDIVIPVTQGGSYAVALELVDNAGNPLSTPITDNVVFSVDILYVMQDIAGLRADVLSNGVGRYYQINSTPTITYKRATRNQKYIQDGTAAILIDDNNGIITVGNQGDGLSGLVGQSFDFNGLLEFVPVQNATVATGATITPQVVTIADVIATPEDYESELLQINGVTFDATNTTFATNTNVPVTAPTATTFRPIFSEADYIGQNIPTSATNIICFAGQSTAANVPTTNQVYLVARSLADLTLETKSFDAIAGLKMYPNPLTGNILNFSSNANAAMTVQVYDVLGKEVVKGNVINNTFNTGNLNAGIYIVKITEEGKTATRKLVVK
ncbi:Por secretion system C-terminal sorting domain-containing protein [Flavobacterium sp. 9AF]|uniref:T9SS type A sorting domain-containing protein n=1 Tax=Flavobacterium sp. 9AF TaxID=2653142 RepID=UPI0012F3521D|nr:T9SS type A sorting domain-containing protein [Flavobacterium sp. 9AF]VXB25441.1 Por secretion system C-terminal sorting domain-containing protein [Flavobacterium sp. 9AF]